MSGYRELRERVADILYVKPAGRYTECADTILAEVLRTLETVTPEMEESGLRQSYGLNTIEALAKDWLAMLRASPLSPPITTP